MACITEKVELFRGPYDGMLVEVAPGSLAVYVTTLKTKCECCDQCQVQVGYREPGDELMEMPHTVSTYIPVEQGSCKPGELRRFELSRD